MFAARRIATAPAVKTNTSVKPAKMVPIFCMVQYAPEARLPLLNIVQIGEKT
jgi:hypothetical protein